MEAYVLVVTGWILSGRWSHGVTFAVHGLADNRNFLFRFDAGECGQSRICYMPDLQACLSQSEDTERRRLPGQHNMVMS